MVRWEAILKLEAAISKRPPSKDTAVLIGRGLMRQEKAHDEGNASYEGNDFKAFPETKLRLAFAIDRGQCSADKSAS